MNISSKPEAMWPLPKIVNYDLYSTYCIRLITINKTSIIIIITWNQFSWPLIGWDILEIM